MEASNQVISFELALGMHVFLHDTVYNVVFINTTHIGVAGH